LPLFEQLFTQLIEIEKRPYTPVTSKRKMKILFAGLDDSGKTSFLLSVDRKYSKLIGLKPTRGASIKSIETLGATIFLWDLGGQSGFREKYLNKAQIYLYEADLIFYFIDLKNKSRFKESFEYLQEIKTKLKGFVQSTPIIYIFSKGDPDIINSANIKNNIEFLKSKLIDISGKKEQEIYITSIFSIFTILRAFSRGISKLSPNRELINFNLKNFSVKAGVYLSLLLSTDGLVLADYYSLNVLSLTEFSEDESSKDDKERIRNVFEVTAPQFAMLYKIFSKFRTLEQDEAIFKITNSVIVFKKIQISDFNMFILFLIDNENKKDTINATLPDFLNRTEDLLIRYIS
ncbi:MAG: ADP-ribosylation factor-like protein, partial [Promethearchaeota archaeon]